MTPERERLVRAVEYWQSNPLVHPLTCGVDSTHTELVPGEARGMVILMCLDCNYRQGIGTNLRDLLLAAYDAAHPEEAK